MSPSLNSSLSSNRPTVFHAKQLFCALLSLLPAVLNTLVWSSNVYAEDVAPSIHQTIDRLDSKTYMMPITSGTSSRQGIKGLVLESPEGKILMHHCPEAVSKILLNLKAPISLQEQTTAIAYFVILEACKDPRALSALADYMKSLRYTNDFKVLEMAYSYGTATKHPDCGGFDRTHAFLYALDALQTFGIEVPSPSSCFLFEKRHTLAQAARTKFENLTTQK